MLKKSLDLTRVQVHRQDPVRPRGREQVRHQLRRDRDARLVFAILPRIPVVRDDRRDPRRRRALERVDHDQQLHDVVVHRAARRLDDEDILPAHILQDLEVELAVAECRQRWLCREGFPGARRFRWPGRDWHFRRRPSVRDRVCSWFRYCLLELVTRWLGREDSNLRMQVPKTCVLPLDDAPAITVLCRTGGRTGLRKIPASRKPRPEPHGWRGPATQTSV